MAVSLFFSSKPVGSQEIPWGGLLLPDGVTAIGRMTLSDVISGTAVKVNADGSLNTTPGTAASAQPLRGSLGISDTDLRFPAIDINTAGANTILAAPGAGKRILITNLVLIASAAVSVQLADSGGNISGVMAFPANGGLANSYMFGTVWCDTNKSFIISLGGAVQVGGYGTYRIVS